MRQAEEDVVTRSPRWFARAALAGLVATAVGAMTAATAPAAPADGHGAGTERRSVTVSLAPSVANRQAAGPVGYQAVVPTRVIDTRSSVGGSRISAGGTAQFLLGGQAGVPDDAAAVSVNLTAAGPAASGYLTAYPCGATVPSTSTVNYVGGQPSANAAVVALGAGGLMCVTSFAASDVIIDVNGYFFSGGNGYWPSVPVRIRDTRVSPNPIAPPPLPTGAVAAVLNVTAASPRSDGYLSLVPCSNTGEPPTSTVNFINGVTQANLAITPLANGCVYAFGQADQVVDYFGGFAPGGTAYFPLPQPEREFDSRNDPANGNLPFAPDGVFSLALPPDLVGAAKAINLNVTATGTQGDGFITVYPCSQGAPNASNLNYRRGDTVAASAFGSFDEAGEVCVKTSAVSHLIVDSLGVFG